MGGVGKTTLLKSIFNRLKEDASVAGVVYYLNVAQHCDEFRLQEKIAKFFGVDLSGMESLDSRSSPLHSKLCSMDRLVLILDDVWGSFKMEKVGIPLGNNNCKISFSTRDKKVCSCMGCEDCVIPVEILSKEDALELFCNILGNYEKLEPKIQKIAVSIAGLCHCLPLAIVVISVSMRDAEDIHEWRNAQTELSNPNRGHDTMEEEVHNILKFSFERLKKEVQKSCFLNCALYLEFRAMKRDKLISLKDHAMWRDDLIDLWTLEGLLDRMGNRSEQLSKGQTIINHLESACLLEPLNDYWYGKKSVKMHDLMRGTAIAIIKQDPRFLIKSGVVLDEIIFGRKLWSKDLVNVSISHSDMKEIPDDMSPDTPNLTALLLNDNEYLLEIPKSLLVRMKALKVLDLSGSAIKRLPESISDLESLRALLLYSCTKLEYVPSVAELTKLRVLGLPMNKVLEMPKGIELLECLEKLTYYKWKISDVSQFNSFMKFAKSLTRYVIDVYIEEFFLTATQPLSKVLPMLRPYPCDRSISIIGALGNGQAIPIIPPTAEAVNFHCIGIRKKGNLVDTLPSFPGITELKSLDLSMCKGFEYITTSASTCPQFETLVKMDLAKLGGFKRIAKYGAFSFSNLVEFKIMNCDSLEVGIPIKSAHHTTPLLPNLKNFGVYNCRELKEIFDLNGSSSSSFFLK